jgi:sugar/nucleoside kinase (ribokinase family)
MSLVIVGSVAYDGVETPRGKVDRILGGAATYIALSASYFTQPKIVAIVGDDFASEDETFLANRQIDLEGLERVPGKSFFWQGVYSEDMNSRETLRTDLNVFADFQPKIPQSYADSSYLMLGNIQPELQKSVYKQMKAVRFAGGDTMDFWIGDFREQLLETIRDWDFLLINDSEARMLSGKHSLKEAAKEIRALGPSNLVIKRGEYGAVLFNEDGYFVAPGYLLDNLTDPTGAGDCFAGGFFGYLAEKNVGEADAKPDPMDFRRAVIYGSVMGSFACEDFGPNRFRTLSRKDIDERFEEFSQFARF